MAITGTGSANDPFIVSNWSELASAAATTGIATIYIKFKEGVIEDLSDTSISIVSAYNLNIDFNGAIFVNGKFEDVFVNISYITTVNNNVMHIDGGVFLNFKVSKSFMRNNTTNHTNCGFTIMNSVLDIYLDNSDAYFWSRDGASGVLRYCKQSRLTLHGMGSIGDHAIFHDTIIKLDLVAKYDLPPMDSDGTTLLYKEIGYEQEMKHVGPLKCNRQLLTAADINSYYPVRTRNTLYIDCWVTGRLRNMDGNTDDTIYFCCSEGSIIEVECTFLSVVHADRYNIINNDKTIPLYYTASIMQEGDDSTIHARTVSIDEVFSKNSNEIRDDNLLYELGFSVKPPEGS